MSTVWTNVPMALKVTMVAWSFELRRKRPVRTRMRGVVQAGGEKLALTRLEHLAMI